MGLDLVEAFMSVEEEFDISIPDEDAMVITTPRQLIEYLMARPELAGRRSRDAVAESVWQIVENEFGVERKNFTEDSRFIQDMGAG
jgi:acyl carrier protein